MVCTALACTALVSPGALRLPGLPEAQRWQINRHILAEQIDNQMKSATSPLFSMPDSYQIRSILAAHLCVERALNRGA